MVLIIPIQFVLAIIMALVIQQNLKFSGNGFFLYVFAIPLAASDLAVGIVWFSIFTTNGYLNTILMGLGIIDAPVTYLSAETRYWIIVAIVLAEVWRATSIVMVIVVSGLQAISNKVLEAAELFGAGLWQRLRHVILPLLKPSLQVALILRTILALQVFAVVVALSGGDIVTVLAHETYRQYNDFRNLNVAAAYAGLDPADFDGKRRILFAYHPHPRGGTSMSTLTESGQPTAVSASAEVQGYPSQDVAAAKRLIAVLAYLVAIVIVLWILVPIWFIGSMALTTQENVRAFPKGVLPFH